MTCPKCNGTSRYVRQCGLCLGIGYVSMPKAMFTPDIALSAIAGALIVFAWLLASITGWG